MKKFDFKQPEFLFCEIAIKDQSQNDDRIWIYHRPSLSLIEFVNVDNFIDFKFKGTQHLFQYEHSDDHVENWVGVYVQNNCEQTGWNHLMLLANAFNYLQKYFKWEDKNIKEAGS